MPTLTLDTFGNTTLDSFLLGMHENNEAYTIMKDE